MKVIDMFSGLEGFSQAFKERGHQVLTIDIEPKFNPIIVADIGEMTIENIPKKFHKPDVILASPPCNCFSVMTIGKYWKDDNPKNPKLVEAIDLVAHTMKLIINLYPRYWFLENPRGMMRRILGKSQAMITQCQYGKDYMKPTDLWGVFPKGFKPKKCKNGADCHLKTKRSARKGIQDNRKTSEIWSLGGMKEREGLSALRSKIPYDLSLAICLACEKELKLKKAVR